MTRYIPLLFPLILVFVVFRQFFFHGYIPIPASFMVAWYEPWKTEFSLNGVPIIPHKAVGDDVFRQLYPFKMLAAEYFRKGQLPLWNPYNGAGQPLLANLHPGYFNPLSIALFLGEKTGWAWYIMTHVPLLFLSMYWFMRSVRATVAASIISGTILTLSEVVVVRYMFGEFLFAFAMLPVLLLLIERRTFLLVPFVVALALITVQPQISFYVLLTALLFARSMRFAGFVILGVGLASFQLFPSFELYQHANVTVDSSAFIFQKFLMPVTHLFSVIIPNYFGNSGTYNFWGVSDYVETVGSVGMIAILLSFFALKVKRAQFFLWASLITILLTLDWLLPRLLYHIPLPILSTSVPTRLYLFTVFFVSVLAGLGFDAKPKKYMVFVLLFLGLVALFFSRFFSCPSQVPACGGVALRNTVLELITFSVGSALLFLPRFRIGVIIVLVASGLYNAWKFLPMSPKEYVMRDHPIFSELRAIAPLRAASPFATDFATQYRYFDTNYYDPLYIRRYGELVSYVNTGDRLKGLTRSDVNIISDATVSAEISFRRERFWDFTGTKAQVTKNGDWSIGDRPTALPRAYLVQNIRVEPDSDRLLAQLFDPKMDFLNSAFVETPIQNFFAGIGTATISSYQANRVGITVQANAPSFLVLSDNYYPGWRATVDGVESTVYRTNYTFRGVVVPKGDHTIIYTYEPESLRIGFWISGMSLLVLIIVIIRAKGSVAKW